MTVVDDYLAATAEPVRTKLAELIALVRATLPDASEKISYQMPTWYLNGNVVHVGAFTAHVSLFPGAAGVAEFEEELDAFVHSKGTIQFPLDRPLPTDLIRRIVTFRAEQQRAKPHRRNESAAGTV